MLFRSESDETLNVGKTHQVAGDFGVLCLIGCGLLRHVFADKIDRDLPKHRVEITQVVVVPMGANGDDFFHARICRTDTVGSGTTIAEPEKSEAGNTQVPRVFKIWRVSSAIWA